MAKGIDLLGKEAVYFIQESVKNDAGEYVPCIAVKGEPGYYRTDWAWGTDLRTARRIAAGKNEVLGYTQAEVDEIILSSMWRADNAK